MQLVIYMSKKYSKLPNIVILDEKDKRLKQKSENVTFPLPKEDLQRIEDMLTYLEMSQIEEYNQKYNLRAGWGLAYIQLGIPKRIFVLSQEIEEGKFERYVVINPKIKSVSEEMVYIEEGEGCLSVNRPTTGIVPRHARMKLEAYDEKGNLNEIRVREELAVGFQHELDHLDGILFTDKIDPKQPFKNKDKYRSI
ncbi:MAG: peptide deformylase [Firmicutes bacterium]|nr:peptide deformylase [Bacillota bacterium]